jgi:hypothetical protein
LHQVQIFFILEGLVEPDDHGVVKLPQDLNLILKTFWVFDHFLGDEFDDTVSMRRFFKPGLVDDAIGPSAEYLP